MQQKPSQIETNYESAIEQAQIQTEPALGQEYSESVHLQNPFISQGPPVHEVHDNQERPVDKPQHEETENYQHMQEDEQPEHQNHHQSQQNAGLSKVSGEQTEFDKFNDLEANQDSNFVEEKVQEKSKIQEKPIIKIQSATLSQHPIKEVQSKKVANNFAQYQNEEKIQQKPHLAQNEPETVIQNQQSPKKEMKKNKSNKKNIQVSETVPVIKANSGETQIQTQAQTKQKQILKVESGNGASLPNNSNSDQNSVVQQGTKIQNVEQSRVSDIKTVSQITDPNSIYAGLIIFQAQRQRIGTTLELFLKYSAKHWKHKNNQKQLITNIQESIQKKRISKTPICNALRDYFDEFTTLCKDLYERSYKFTKSDKQMSANPMINMREELKNGVDELIFLRKATGNEYNRLGEFISTNISKNVVKLFTDYWKAVGLAQNQLKEKKDELYKKEKQFNKRINKVIKVYTNGKQGSSQEEDLFIQMIKYINQEKQYRACLIECGLALIPLKKAFIKAEQVLYQELQVLFNNYKNHFRTLYSLHPKEFTQLQKMQKLIRENNTFEKLSDITDGDYVRSVLITLEKGSVQNLADKEFQKVLNMLHFDEVVGSSLELLKGTTTKTFELKNKAQQVVDTVSGNLLIFSKQSAQMRQKFIIKNIDARIVQEGVVEIDETLKGIIFDSHRTVRITFRDNDRAQELICFLNQVHQNIKQNEQAHSNKK